MANDPTYLITGSTGFLGSFLAYRLLIRGSQPFLLARPREGMTGRERFLLSLSGLERAFGKTVDPSRIRVIEGDVLWPRLGMSEEACEEVAGAADGVIHAAALLSFDGKRSKEIRRCNVEGTRSVTAFCAETKKDLFHVSTAFVCGMAEGSVPETFHRGTSNFRNAYEASKWDAERIVVDAIESGALKGAIFRPSIILGDRSRGFTASFTTLYRWFYAVELMACQEAKRRGRGSLLDVAEDTDLDVDVNVAVDVDLDVDVNVDVDTGLDVDVGFRFPVDPEGIMSIVPVDYVSDALLHIARSGPPEGAVFHLVTRKIPRNRDHLDLVLEALSVRGIILVAPENLPEETMTRREKRILSAVSEYRTYFDCRTDFDDTGTEAALEGSGIGRPEIDQQYVKRIIAYARETDWGRHGPRLEPDAPDSESETARAFFSRHLASFTDQKILPELNRLDAVFRVQLTDPAAGAYLVCVEGARIMKVAEDKTGQTEFTFLVPVKVFLPIVAGKEDPREAFFAGRTDIRGDMEKALSIIPVLKRFFEEYPYDGPEMD